MGDRTLLDTPPRYLLSGTAWFYLWRITEIIEFCCGPDWHPTDDLYGELSLFLHPELSYPAIHGPAVVSTYARADLVMGVPVTLFRSTTYAQLDITPRMTIRWALRRWIARRRRFRAAARATILLFEHLLPDSVLALPQLVLYLARFL